MRLQALFFVAMLAVVLSDGLSKCPRYRCQEVGSKDACAKGEMLMGEVVYSLQPCRRPGDICDIIHPFGQIDTCAAYSSRGTLFPGEYCRNDKECISSKCVTTDERIRVCRGNDENGICGEDEDCNPGLSCQHKVCKSVASLGAACDADKRCSAAAVCEGGKCVKIGSKKKGENAATPAACATFYISKGKCATGPKLHGVKGSNKEACPSNQLCTYTFDAAPTEEIATPCSCGMTDTTEAFCIPGRGDIHLDNYIEYLEDEEIATRCSVAKGPLCVYKPFEEMGAKFYKAFVMYEAMTRGFLYFNNSDCVKKVINYQYWYALERSKEPDTHASPAILYSIHLISVIMVGLILVCLGLRALRRKAKENEEERLEHSKSGLLANASIV